MNTVVIRANQFTCRLGQSQMSEQNLKEINARLTKKKLKYSVNFNKYSYRILVFFLF